MARWQDRRITFNGLARPLPSSPVPADRKARRQGHRALRLSLLWAELLTVGALGEVDKWISFGRALRRGFNGAVDRDTYNAGPSYPSRMLGARDRIVSASLAPDRGSASIVGPKTISETIGRIGCLEAIEKFYAERGSWAKRSKARPQVNLLAAVQISGHIDSFRHYARSATAEPTAARQ